LQLQGTYLAVWF